MRIFRFLFKKKHQVKYQEELAEKKRQAEQKRQEESDKHHFRLDLINKKECHNLSKEQFELLRKIKTGVISFTQIDKKYTDEEFCLEAVKHNGYILKFIPKEIVNLNLCIEAVTK